ARGAVVSAETPLALGSYADGVTPFLGGLARAELHDEALTAEALASAWQRWQAEHPLADHFSFAQASDLHVTDTRSVELINDAVDQINADPRVAFSLWLGDLTRQSEPDEMLLARLALKRLVRPWYVLRGNHDQYGGSFEAVFGATHQVVRHAGWVFLLADTNPGDEVPMAASQQTWLKEQLAGTERTTPLVLATHHPLMPQTKGYLLAGAAEVLGLFGGHNLKAALAGHFHGNQEQRANGVLFTTTACLSSTRTNHDGGKARGYRLFHCREGEISTEFVPVAEL
ncbi:MAG: metallophosphoesterase, partial [Armatimonadetes bacterium]|nr:metallophosphoesterase [Armatimonadota bacterium]